MESILLEDNPHWVNDTIYDTFVKKAFKNVLIQVAYAIENEKQN